MLHNTLVIIYVSQDGSMMDFEQELLSLTDVMSPPPVPPTAEIRVNSEDLVNRVADEVVDRMKLEMRTRPTRPYYPGWSTSWISCWNRSPQPENHHHRYKQVRTHGSVITVGKRGTWQINAN